MDQIIAYAIESGAGIWAVLFVCLLGYVLKTNYDRENRYIRVIDKLSGELGGDVKLTKDAVARIERHIIRRNES